MKIEVGRWEDFRRRTHPRFFFHPETARERTLYIAKRYPDEVERSLAIADAALRRQFTFEHLTHRFEGEIDWRAAPSGDREWTYLLNRHSWWTDLGRAYLLTGEEAYAREFAAELRGWMSHPCDDDLTCRKLEIGIRARNWLWALYHFLAWPGFDPRTGLEMLESLREHGRRLVQVYGEKEPVSNWGMVETRGLAYLAMMFPEFPEAMDWRDTVFRRFEEQVAKQVLADGWHVELASSYHHAVISCLMEPVLLARINEVPVPKAMETALIRMLECEMYTAQPDRRLPRLGDADALDARPVLMRGALAFDRPEFKAVAEGSTGVRTLTPIAWLFGPGGVQRYQGMKAVWPAETSKAFPDAGYYVMRSDWSREAGYLVFDCGPVITGLGRSHSHSDALSIVLSAYGRPLLVDPGRYTYFEDGEMSWRKEFKSTRSHNTVVVDGLEQSEYLGGSNWGKIARAGCVLWHGDRVLDAVMGWHDGYSRLEAPVGHMRAIFYMKEPRRLQYWLIIDSLVGSGEHLLEQYWHFAPGLEVKPPEKIPAEEYRCEFIADEIVMATLCDISDIGGDRASGQRVQAELFMGWDSPDYGLKIPASVARIAMQTQLPADIVTSGGLVRGGQMPLVRLGKGNGPPAAALAGTGEDGGNRYHVLVSKARSSTGNYEVRATRDDLHGMERQDGGKRYWVEIDGLCDRFIMPDPEEIWAWRQAGSV
ncbi:MAG: heparinase II/III family protein [Firmicutes bacterium]|nr:heparinase II/III family protein [Bacillota bacterium]